MQLDSQSLVGSAILSDESLPLRVSHSTARGMDSDIGRLSHW